jgi:hypothetical protein
MLIVIMLSVVILGVMAVLNVFKLSIAISKAITLIVIKFSVVVLNVVV